MDLKKIMTSNTLFSLPIVSTLVIMNTTFFVAQEQGISLVQFDFKCSPQYLKRF